MVVEITKDELWPYYRVDYRSTAPFYSGSVVEDLPNEFLERYQKACKEFFECQDILRKAYGVDE